LPFESRTLLAADGWPLQLDAVSQVSTTADCPLRNAQLAPF
jgi:hypothetical protein